MTFRDVTPDDYKVLYAMLLDRRPELNISHKTMPEYNKHCEFWDNNPYPTVKMIENKNRLLGYFYLTRLNEIGLFLIEFDEELFRRLLIEILKTYSDRRLLVNISINNTEYQRVFVGCGFKMIQQTYELDRTYV